MNRCRNCDGTELDDLGFIGMVAPFFLKRVFGLKLGTPSSVSPLKRLIRKAASIPQALLQKLNKPVALVEMQQCQSCSFVQTKLPFAESSINRLYEDYRSETYNRERIEYEPAYGPIAEQVGQGTAELDVRVSAATRFMKAHITPDENFTILDYGGADGKFMPRIEGKKFVFEISNIEPIAGVTRIYSQAELGTYSLVQLTHVIEHVVQPLDLVKEVGARVQPGGFLYLETPQELTDAQRAELKSGNRVLTIHEHINSYSMPAVSKLMEKAGFELVAIEAGPVNVGWASAVHLRALGRKP